MSCSANFTINSTCYLGRGRQYSLLEKNVLTRRTPQLMTGGPRRKRCTAPVPKPPWQNPQPSALGLPWPTAGIAAPLATTNREHVEGRELAPADMMDFTAVDGDGTRQESQMIDLVCAWCDVDARVFYRLKRAKYLVCNIIYDATLKIIAVAKVKANIVVHICSSIAWQAGARPSATGAWAILVSLDVAAADDSSSLRLILKTSETFVRHWQIRPLTDSKRPYGPRRKERGAF
jgi:hypothetical protein